MKIDRFWAGTDEALAEYTLFIHANAKEAYGYQPQGQVAQEGGSRLLRVQGAVGVVSVAGALTNGESGYRNYMTTYGEIRAAMLQAAADPQIKFIMLDVKSGGGSVQGLSDTADLVRTIDAKVKPVYSFTDASMASAAYWLGSAARKVYASNMAEVGSIGVIAVHAEYTKLMKDAGVTHTVFRSGEFKALGHPMEALSPKAEGVFQAQIDYMAGMFDSYISDRRGMTVEAFKKRAGEGRVFVGQQAVDAGLVDSITTFDALMSKLEASAVKAQVPNTRPQHPSFAAATTPVAEAARQVILGSLDFCEKGVQSGPNPPQGQEMPNPLNALTDQMIAALAEGGVVVPPAAQAPAAPAAQAPAQAPAAPAAQAPAEPAAQAPAAQAPVAPAQAPAPSAEVAAFLQGELAKAQAQIVNLTVNLQAAAAKAEAAATAMAGFRAIAQASVDRMKVAMSLPGGVAASSDEALLAEHASLRSRFEANFIPGGVAAVSSAPVQSKAESADHDVARQARIQATRLK